MSFLYERSRVFRCTLRTARCRLHTDLIPNFFEKKYKHYYIHNTISSLHKEAWVSMQKCLSHTNDLVCSAARCAPCAVVCVRVHVFMFL